MFGRKLFVVFFVLIVAVALAACAAPEPTKAPPAPTSAPAATTAPVATTAPAATKPPDRPTDCGSDRRSQTGGKVTWAVWQSPITLNINLGTQTVMTDILALVQEGMSEVNPEGVRIPTLAKEIPTVQNGGVSADGKTVTWKLKEGLVYRMASRSPAPISNSLCKRS